jgi:hypothetical protein
MNREYHLNPVVACIVIPKSGKVIFNVIRESLRLVNVIRDGIPSYPPYIYFILLLPLYLFYLLNTLYIL